MAVEDAVRARYADRPGVDGVLFEQALALARVLDDNFESVKSAPPAKGPVSKELRDVCALIDERMPKGASKLDELAPRRGARRPKPSGDAAPVRGRRKSGA